MEDYHKIWKQEALGDLFCLKMSFQKNTQILEAWKPTEDMKFWLFFTSSSTYELNINIVLGT